MTLNHVKMKYLGGVIYLIFLPKTLFWNKTMFPSSNLLHFAELVKSELMKSISKKITNIPLSIQFNAAYCKDFKSLYRKN